MKILAAEDNELLGRLLAKTIQSLGWDCTIAKNGNEAIDMISREKYDVVLLDINMPGIDGYEAARWINSNFTGTARPMVVALTGAMEENSEEKCREYGFDAWLDKPVQSETLKKVIGKNN